MFQLLIERAPGFEPGYSAWKADARPLCHARMSLTTLLRCHVTVQSNGQLQVLIEYLSLIFEHGSLVGEGKVTRQCITDHPQRLRDPLWDLGRQFNFITRPDLSTKLFETVPCPCHDTDTLAT